MSAFARSRLRAATIAAFALGAGLSRAAGAQPNPFDDYERFKAGEPPAAAAPSAPAPVIRTAPMTWSMGLRSQLSFSRLTYERGDGANDGAATALLFRLTPAIDVFILDRIQIGISPGLLARVGGNNIGDDAGDANMLIEATGHYFAPLGPRFSFVPGVGVGGYFGSGSRKTSVGLPGGSAVRAYRDTSTSGLSLALSLGVAYQIDDHIQLRSGVTASAFFGWDSMEGRDAPIRNSATHIGIPVELFYVF